MDRDELINRYIDGHMNAAEEAAFLKQLESDPALRELVDVDLTLQRAVKRELQQLPKRRKYPSSVFFAQLTQPVDTTRKAWYKQKKFHYTVGVISLAILGILLMPLFLTDQPKQPQPAVHIDSVAQVAPVDTTKRQSALSQRTDSIRTNDSLPKPRNAKNTIVHELPHPTAEQEENEQPPRVYSNGVHVDINKQKENSQK